MKKYMKKHISQGIRLPIKGWSLLSFIVVFLSIGCKSQNLDKTENKDENGMVLTMLMEDGYYATDSLETMVITDFKSLNGFFSKVNRTRKPGLPVPIVDFSKDMVIVVCGGARKNVKRLFLKKEEETFDTVIISVKEEPNVPSNAVVSYSFCLYKMTKTDKSISFIHE